MIRKLDELKVRLFKWDTGDEVVVRFEEKDIDGVDIFSVTYKGVHLCDIWLYPDGTLGVDDV